MLGGSIQPNTIRIKDVEPQGPRTDEEDPRSSWAKILQRLAADEPGPNHFVQLSQMRDDLTNYQWRNDVAHYQHANWYQRHAEEDLYKGAMPMFSGHGAARDSEAAHRFFMESFQNHPELLQMYTRGSKKPKQQLDPQWRSHHTQPHLQIAHSRIR